MAEKIEYYTYPPDGTRKTVGAGRTVIDFYDGTVKLPDGTDETLSGSLKTHSRDYVRSVMVECDQAARYGLDDKGLKPINAGNVQTETNQEFTRLVIETTTSTQINVWACTHPTAKIGISKRT